MKKSALSVFSLILALICLVVSMLTLVSGWKTQEKLEEQIRWQAEINDRLYEKIDVLTAQIAAMESGAVSPVCNLLVEDWLQEEKTLTLVSAYAEIQIPAGTQVASSQLVLWHNGAEHSRVDITLEAGETAGLYRRSLTDTWFMLPELADEDSLELYLEVQLSDGQRLQATDISWYCMDGVLSSAVG